MRGRGYSPSPSPRRRGRSRTPPPRGRYGGGGHDSSAPTSLLVRNLRHDCRPDDLRRLFEEFGPVRDIYLPRDYYSGQPKGFGFVEFIEPGHADEAKYQMDRQVFQGRELTVLFAEQNRKKPTEMQARDRGRSRRYDRRRSPPRRRYERSPSRSPKRRRYESPRSVSPQEKRSNYRSPVREDRDHSPVGEEDRSPSPYAAGSKRSRSRSPDVDRAASPPFRGASWSPSGSRSRSPADGPDYRRRSRSSEDGSPY